MKKNKNLHIPLQNVKIKDKFWSPLQELIINKVIPYQEKILSDEVPGVAKSHAIANFRIAAGLEEGDFYGMVFQDSDVAKWLEAVAYSLSLRPDPALEERADRIIDIIGKAQQEDGYLNTYFTIKEPEHRWQNLQECHELYCAGHMMEAAVAYYEATGKEKLLHIMERMADHMDDKFTNELYHGIPGHQEVEIGLMKLYHLTGKEHYLKLANYFIEERGKNPDYFVEESKKRGWSHFGNDPEDRMYNQCHATVYEQNEAVGHCVRAVYMYTAMADLAGTLGNKKLYEACDRLWDSITQKRMFLTGGIGSTADGEAFTRDYHLPGDLAYAETCAAIGLTFFAHQMLEDKPDGKFADVMERTFYNGTISGMQTDGTRFFYVNPLEVNPGISGEIPEYKHVLPQRPGWYRCACCPPNLIRLITSMGKYIWSETEEAIYSHMFIGQDTELAKAKIHVDSQYPWNGWIEYKITGKVDTPFTLAVHIPGYINISKMNISINGSKINIKDNLIDGYVYIHRIWGKEDLLTFQFEMPIRRIYANQNITDCAGCVALMRGPIVYCFEEIDNGNNLSSIRIPESLNEEICQGTDLFSGKSIIRLDGYKYFGNSSLYSEEKPHKEPVRLTAIPYYLWANRGIGQMRVWMLEE